MRETLIILGAGVMQGPAIKIAKELGFYTIALDGSSNAPCVAMADKFEQIDLKDKEGIETFARSLESSSSRIGIMTAGTDFSASVAWTAEKLGLPGIPYEAALNASDKGRMRACFKAAKLPSPEYVTISQADLEEISRKGAKDAKHAKEEKKESEDLRKSTSSSSPLFSPSSLASFASLAPLREPLLYPLVIKPVDNMGSRGCRRVDSNEELYEAAKTAIGFSRSGRAIVESYMEGPEFSVDAIVYKNEITICGLADRHIFFPPYFIEMGHTMPTVIEKEKQDAMLETFCAGIHALGIAGKDNIGAAKGDIKLTANGPMIGEIAARLSGGYMSGWTYPYASGALPIKGAILAAMGREPQGISPIKSWTCAERAFISIPGTVKAICGAKEAEKMPNVNDLFLRITEGSKVSFPENNVTKCGNILSSASDRTTAINAAESAAKSILIHLDPDDAETSAFLREEFHAKAQRTQRGREEFNDDDDENLSAFPPSAFQITNELQQTLAELPDTNPSSPLIPSPSSFASFASLAPLRESLLSILPFPSFTSSNLTDYMGRSVEESLDAVRVLTGFPLPIGQKDADNVVIMGKSFWAALIRGGYQGAVYYIENLGKNEKDKNKTS